jgi:hypothetical protein
MARVYRYRRKPATGVDGRVEHPAKVVDGTLNQAQNFPVTEFLGEGDP